MEVRDLFRVLRLHLGKSDEELLNLCRQANVSDDDALHIIRSVRVRHRRKCRRIVGWSLAKLAAAKNVPSYHLVVNDGHQNLAACKHKIVLDDDLLPDPPDNVICLMCRQIAKNLKDQAPLEPVGPLTPAVATVKVAAGLFCFELYNVCCPRCGQEFIRTASIVGNGGTFCATQDGFLADDAGERLIMPKTTYKLECADCGCPVCYEIVSASEAV